ncbi:50S ribosomal protein L18 [Candidatus Peregrinibacteria bacterium]|nr:50S ribosomal protein L18 [Candidatus Peregrinibacteria bacterium]
MKNLKQHQRLRRKIRAKGKISHSEKPRLVVFKSLNNNYAQLIDDKSQKTIVGASDLKIEKGTKMERAKQVGEELAKLAKEQKIDSCVLDRNGYKYHGRIKAIAEGAREGGLKF